MFKFLLTALLANTRRDDASKFSSWKYGHFQTPTTKTGILTFLENKRLFARTRYIKLLVYLKAIYGQKMKKWIFQLLPLDARYFLTVALNYLALIVTSCFTCAGVKITFQTLVNILWSMAVLTKPMIKVNNENDGALA